MVRQTFLVAAVVAALAAAYGTAAAQQAPKRTAGLSPNCTANAPVREFLVVAGEWDTVPKGKDGKPAAYTDRGMKRAADSKLERYTFDPSVLIVKRGDCVSLRIHDVKGDRHNVVIEGTDISSENAPLLDDAGKVIGKATARANPNTYEGPEKLKAGEFVRGEEVLLRFQANQPGTYRMICEVHTFVGPKGELRAYDDKGQPVKGPMVAYITVLP
jgi:plastocyanin